MMKGWTCSNCHTWNGDNDARCGTCGRSVRAALASQAAVASVASRAASPRLTALIAAIQRELGASHPLWAGAGVPIHRYENPVSAANKVAVAAQGAAHGCHTCRSDITTDRAQPWIGDHIPPTQLADRVIQGLVATGFHPHLLGARLVRVLFPQCDECAALQAGLVNRLNASGDLAGDLGRLTAKERALLCGGKAIAVNGNCIESTSDYVTGGESAAIQAYGGRDGCHSCGTGYPAHFWHADHCPPVAFHSPQVELVLQGLGIAMPAFEARPQCPRCSHAQGGRMAAIEAMVRDAMQEAGIKSYK